VNNPPREGFSQQALLARLEILRGARDTLADPELRADYNQALVEDEAGTLVLDVPWTKVKNSILFSSLSPRIILVSTCSSKQTTTSC
jgi:hypothetical protein